MIIRKSWSVIVVSLAVVVSYYLLVGVLEWLRVKAGVGSDTGTPIDFAAWLGCVFVAAVIAGCLSRGILRSAGLLGVVMTLCALLACLAAQLNGHDGGSLQMEACWTIFGTLAFPVLAWIVFAGFAVGWAMNVGQKENRGAWIALAVLASALVTLIIVFYPLDKYFMRMWGNG